MDKLSELHNFQRGSAATIRLSAPLCSMEDTPAHFYCSMPDNSTRTHPYRTTTCLCRCFSFPFPKGIRFCLCRLTCFSFPIPAGNLPLLLPCSPQLHPNLCHLDRRRRTLPPQWRDPRIGCCCCRCTCFSFFSFPFRRNLQLPLPLLFPTLTPNVVISTGGALLRRSGEIPVLAVAVVLLSFHSRRESASVFAVALNGGSSGLQAAEPPPKQNGLQPRSLLNPPKHLPPPTNEGARVHPCQKALNQTPSSRPKAAHFAAVVERPPYWPLLLHLR